MPKPKSWAEIAAFLKEQHEGANRRRQREEEKEFNKRDKIYQQEKKAEKKAKRAQIQREIKEGKRTSSGKIRSKRSPHNKNLRAEPNRQFKSHLNKNWKYNTKRGAFRQISSSIKYRSRSGHTLSEFSPNTRSSLGFETYRETGGGKYDRKNKWSSASKVKTGTLTGNQFPIHLSIAIHALQINAKNFSIIQSMVAEQVFKQSFVMQQFNSQRSIAGSNTGKWPDLTGHTKRTRQRLGV